MLKTERRASELIRFHWSRFALISIVFNCCYHQFIHSIKSQKHQDTHTHNQFDTHNIRRMFGCVRCVVNGKSDTLFKKFPIISRSIIEPIPCECSGNIRQHFHFSRTRIIIISCQKIGVRACFILVVWCLDCSLFGELKHGEIETTFFLLWKWKTFVNK